MNKKIFTSLVSAVVFLVSGCAWMPESRVHTHGTGPLDMAVGIYRGPLNHLGAVRTGSCPMHPSCSEYAEECLSRYNTPYAWMRICDRLIRCGRDETEISPKVITPHGLRTLDTVSGNEPGPLFPEKKQNPD